MSSRLIFRHLLPLFLGRAILVCVLALMVLIGTGFAQEEDEDEEESLFLPGLVAEYVGRDGVTHQRRDEVVAMDWGSGVPDVRVPAGDFSARWTGRLQVWATGEYQFRLYAVGKVRLQVADEVVLEGETAEPDWIETAAFEIEWGEPSIEIDFEKTAAEAQISFFWRGPDFDWEPVSIHSLLHERERAPDDRFQRGRFLARALRCAACHKIADYQERISAPALDRLPGMISRDWIVDWLSDAPNESGPAEDEQIVRRMPHFALSREDAGAIAAYLTTAGTEAKLAKQAPAGKAEEGRKVFFGLGCLACHRVGELGESGLFGGGDLSAIADKRPAEFFEQWMKDPAALNRDHRMPIFRLTEYEPSQLAAYLASLKSEGGSQKDKEVPTDSAEIERGRALVAQHRCQSCHRLPETDSKPLQVPLALKAGTTDWQNSCAALPSESGNEKPAYALSSGQQEALRVYLTALPREKSQQKVKLDGRFLMRERNCLGCHSRGVVQGIETQIQAIATAEHSLERGMANIKPPALDSIGDKLHDKILLDAIATRREVRRDWLMVRMPKFRMEDDETQAIADYLIREDRIPDPPEQDQVRVEEATLRAAGTRLVTTDGFGCTSCHQIGDVKPTHVAFGVHGPNLSQIGREVRYPWFLRWVLNPTRISPRMEMPAVKTPIRGVLEGHLNHQHAAVWAVLNQQGFQPPKPNPVRVIRQRNEEGNTDLTQVIIDNVEARGVEAGEHSFVKPLLIGLPNRHNVLFDLERYRLAGWTQGDTARQRLRNKYWYWEAAGRAVVAASVGESEIAIRLGEKRVLPTIDPAFPPEADQTRAVGQAWSFDSRVQFFMGENNSSAPVEIKIVQTFQPLTGEQESGFVRTVEFRGVPQGATLELDALPGVPTTVDEAGRIARSTTAGEFEVECLSGQARFESADVSARLVLSPDSEGTCRVELAYRSGVPTDRYLQKPFPPMVVEQEVLHVLPGFEATRLPIAEEITPTAFAWDRTGQLLISTLKGRIWRAIDTNDDAIEDRLELVADGLSAPFGLATLEEDGIEAIDVADKTALLRLTDTDGDGRIDRTRTVASGWGHSTDYHGWVLGLPQDEEGNYYVVVTNRNGPPSQLRGRVLKLEKLAESESSLREYRVKPLAMGLRFPVGIARSRSGELFVTDNQGQYNPYNELNHVVEGSHFGFFNLSGMEETAEIQAMPRSGPAVGMPHPWVRSVNGICFLETPEELLKKTGQPLFGPFEGHLLGCECTTRQLVRISLQKVGGRIQGAAYPLTIAPSRGTNPLLRPLVARVAPDGAILVGSVHDSAWGAGRNTGEVVKLRFHGDLPAGIAEMRVVDTGFELEFTKPVDRAKAADLKNYVLVSSRRVPTSAYGAAEVDSRTEKITSARVSEDARLVTLTLPELRTGFVYALRLRNLTVDGKLFHPAEAYYSLGPLE